VYVSERSRSPVENRVSTTMISSPSLRHRNVCGKIVSATHLDLSHTSLWHPCFCTVVCLETPNFLTHWTAVMTHCTE
jgi:hypothetical protein